MSESSPPPSPPAKRLKLDGDASPSVPTQTETTTQTQLERAVGITEYIDPDLKGWCGILKQRYTDFLVNEIDEAGKVMHLTSLTVDGKENKKNAAPAQVKKQEEVKDTEVKQEEDAPPPVEFKLSPEDFTALAALTSPEITSSCISLYRTLTTTTSPFPTSQIVTPRIESKDSRSALHTLIRRLFSHKLETQTLTGDSEGKIAIKPAGRTDRTNDKKTRARGNRGGKKHANPTEKFESLGGEYCHFLLYKENRDTMQAVGLLGRLLKTGKNSRGVIGFAGTKDRRAVTVQRCSAYRIRAERLAALNEGGDNGFHRGTRVGNFEYKTYGLELGDLGGNEFCITLRECRTVDGEGNLEEVVKRTVESIRKKGFINYFGLQRFGSYSVGTWEVGVKMLQSKWREAVEKILDYDPKHLEAGDENISWEDKARAEACAIFLKSYDFKAAAGKIPRKFAAESTILKIFEERGKKGDGKGGGLDYLGALQAVPRNLRTMYSHAYQSYVWNHAVSARIGMGTQVIEGDLVLIEKKSPRDQTGANMDNLEVDQDGEIVINAPAEDTSDGRPRGQEEFQRARPLSKEEAESGKYTMKDIVLPTPGWDVMYPQNELLEVYKSVMAQHELDPLNMRRSVKEHSLPGSYRKVIATFLGGGCEFEIRKYKGLEQITKTDMEILEAAGAVKAQDGEVEEMEDGMEIDEAEEKIAVVLRLKLGTSTYATMALRELMREGIKAYKPEFSR